MPKALILGGATGLLGQALVKNLHNRGWDTQNLGRDDGDILDMDFLKKQVIDANADIIFNTIAWTQVEDAEDHKEGAHEINRAFPDGLARIIGTLPKGHLVHFSTDYVFSGEHHVPWKETDEPKPINVYGSTKLAGEKAVLEVLPERSCVIRTAWLFGPGRKNFIKNILDACQERDMLNVVVDQTGSPTYTPDLADWSASLAEKRETGIWHCVNSGHANWCELATEAVHLASGPCRIEPTPSSKRPQKAKRPSYTVLDNSKLSDFLGKKPRPWPKALRDYIFTDLQILKEEKKF